MDNASEFVAFALIFVAIGAAIWSLMFAVNWWLATRRAGQADRLHAAEGVLHAIGPRQVEFAGKAAAASYWTVDARYDYSVEGKPYSGDRFALEFNSWYPDETSAVSAARRFRPGDTVTVWYDPDVPATAALDKTPPLRRAYTATSRWLRSALRWWLRCQPSWSSPDRSAGPGESRRIRLADRSSLG